MYAIRSYYEIRMKIIKIDHLGIAVKSIEAGKQFWTNVLGLQFGGVETVSEQKVTTAFFPVGESEVELLESTAPDGPIANYIEKRGEGIQHIAFRVENIEAALDELKAKGVRLIDENRITSYNVCYTKLLRYPFPGDPVVIGSDFKNRNNFL